MAGMLELERSRTRRERTFIGSECAVCEEPLEHTLRGERILQFSCGHVSHEACFYEYIKEFESQYCPTCNAPLGLDTSRGGNVLDLGMRYSRHTGCVPPPANHSQKNSAASCDPCLSTTKHESNNNNGARKTPPRRGIVRPSGIVHEVESRIAGRRSVIAASPNHRGTVRKASENASNDMARDPLANNMHETGARAQLRPHRREITARRVIRTAVGAMITMFSRWKPT